MPLYVLYSLFTDVLYLHEARDDDRRTEWGCLALRQVHTLLSFFSERLAMCGF